MLRRALGRPLQMLVGTAFDPKSTRPSGWCGSCADPERSVVAIRSAKFPFFAFLSGGIDASG